MIPDMTIENTPEAAALLRWADYMDSRVESFRSDGRPYVEYTHLAANALLSIAVQEYERGYNWRAQNLGLGDA